jgi:hypothetical protein
LFGAALALGRVARPFLPRGLRRKMPRPAPAGAWPRGGHARRMIVLRGCVQPSIAPSINAATARVLDRIGIALIEVEEGGCCGAVSFHLNYQHDALGYMKRNIDAWWPLVEAGAEAIVVTASGCGTMVKDYGRLLREDPAYAGKAQRVSELARDVSEVVVVEREAVMARVQRRALPAVAFQSPCTLQHGLNAYAGTRCAPVLRLRGHLFDPAAGDLARPPAQQGGGARVRPARPHRHREHRMPFAHPVGDEHADPPLDRAAGRGHGDAPRGRTPMTA